MRLRLILCSISKGQGMISFIYLAKRINAPDIGGYADVILDACCQNIVEMYEKLLMLNHLQRQLRNKKQRITWLTYRGPLFNCLGLLQLAHFRRFFHFSLNGCMLLLMMRPFY